MGRHCTGLSIPSVLTLAWTRSAADRVCDHALCAHIHAYSPMGPRLRIPTKHGLDADMLPPYQSLQLVSYSAARSQFGSNDACLILLP